MHVYDHRKVIRRKTMNILEMFGAIGGLVRFFNFFFSKFVGYFTGLNIFAIIASQLYNWDEPESMKEQSLNSVETKSKSKINDFMTPIPVIPHLDWHKLVSLFLRGRCRRQWYTDYKKNMNAVGQDMKATLDTVTLMRRLRSYGFAISMLMTSTVLTVVSERAKFKPLKPAYHSKNESLWLKHEPYTFRERILIGIIKMYVTGLHND